MNCEIRVLFVKCGYTSIKLFLVNVLKLNFRNSKEILYLFIRYLLYILFGMLCLNKVAVNFNIIVH